MAARWGEFAALGASMDWFRCSDVVRFGGMGGSEAAVSGVQVRQLNVGKRPFEVGVQMGKQPFSD